MSPIRLTKSKTEQLIDGVCGGLAQYLGVDVTFVRLAFVILGLASGIGILLYFILMFIVPSEADSDEPMGKIVRDNMDDLGQNLSQAQAHPNGRNIAAVLLILMGVWLFLEQLGMSIGFLWPLLLIGLGTAVFLRARR